MSYPIDHTIIRDKLSDALRHKADKSTEICKLLALADRHLEQEQWHGAYSCAEGARKRASQELDNQDEGCAYIRQAEARRGEGSLRESLRFYQMAEKCFSDGTNNHNLAICWAYIVEVYYTNREWSQIIQYGPRARDNFDQMESDDRLQGKNIEADKYREWRQNIQYVMDDAVKNSEPGSSSAHWIEFTHVPVLKEPIPAGPARDLSRLPHDCLAVEQVVIQGKPYEITSLRKDRRVLLMQEIQYVIAPVTGDSMNLENILKGHYVLLRLVDDIATLANNDIVAAELAGEDSATLKQFIVKGNKRYLHPHSSNSAWQDSEIKEGNVRIRGIVVAVLKPASEQ